MKQHHIRNLKLAADYLATYEGPFKMNQWLQYRDLSSVFSNAVNPAKIHLLEQGCKTVGCVHGTCAMSGIPELAAIPTDKTWEDYSLRVYGPLKYETMGQWELWAYCFSPLWAKVLGQETAKAASERILQAVEHLSLKF